MPATCVAAQAPGGRWPGREQPRTWPFWVRLWALCSARASKQASKLCRSVGQARNCGLAASSVLQLFNCAAGVPAHFAAGVPACVAGLSQTDSMPTTAGLLARCHSCDSQGCRLPGSYPEAHVPCCVMLRHRALSSPNLAGNLLSSHGSTCGAHALLHAISGRCQGPAEHGSQCAADHADSHATYSAYGEVCSMEQPWWAGALRLQAHLECKVTICLSRRRSVVALSRHKLLLLWPPVQ